MDGFSENLIDYAKRVDNALREKTPFSTYNRDIMHATEIVAGGFKYAQNEVCLLSHKLDKRLYGTQRIEKLVEDFLSKKNGRLNIIVETDVDSDHPIIRLCRKYPENTTIKRIPDDWQEIYSYNFMTIDDFGYRFEADRKKLSAIVSFNEDEEKETLESIKSCFEFLGNESEAIKAG